jgi:hypothetical protein
VKNVGDNRKHLRGYQQLTLRLFRATVAHTRFLSSHSLPLYLHLLLFPFLFIACFPFFFTSLLTSDRLSIFVSLLPWRTPAPPLQRECGALYRKDCNSTGPCWPCSLATLASMWSPELPLTWALANLCSQCIGISSLCFCSFPLHIF